MKYRIRIEKIEIVEEQGLKWLNNASADGRSAYVDTPPGVLKEQTTEIYDQIVEGDLAVNKLIAAINTPNAF